MESAGRHDDVVRAVRGQTRALSQSARDVQNGGRGSQCDGLDAAVFTGRLKRCISDDDVVCLVWNTWEYMGVEVIEALKLLSPLTHANTPFLVRLG